MCMITYKPRGESLNLDYLKKAFPYNRDGFGLSYHDEKTKIYTTLCFEELLKLVNELMDYELIIHQRDRSVGEISLQNVQPFLIHERAYFHNGTIKSFDQNNAILSDSFYLAKVLDKLDMTTWEMFIEKFTSKSRVAVMHEDGKVSLYGKWFKEGKILFSSNYYKWD